MADRHYSPAERAAALALLARNGGDMLATRAMIDIPATTLRRWANEAEPAAQPAEVGQAFQPAIPVDPAAHTASAHRATPAQPAPSRPEHPASRDGGGGGGGGANPCLPHPGSETAGVTRLRGLQCATRNDGKHTVCLRGRGGVPMARSP